MPATPQVTTTWRFEASDDPAVNLAAAKMAVLTATAKEYHEVYNFPLPTENGRSFPAEIYRFRGREPVILCPRLVRRFILRLYQGSANGHG